MREYTEIEMPYDIVMGSIPAVSSAAAGRLMTRICPQGQMRVFIYSPYCGQNAPLAPAERLRANQVRVDSCFSAVKASSCCGAKCAK